MLVQIVTGQTFYVDPSYTEAITGKTHPVTGEELIFDVNAFSVLGSAVAELQPGDSLYINGLSSDSITVPETVSLYLTDSTAPLLRIGQDDAKASFSGDIVTVISGSTFGSENGWLVGRLGTISGDVSVLIENSVLGSGWPIGRSTPQLRLAESCTFGADTETISVTIRDSVLNEDISLLHESGIGSKTKPATVILTMERVTAPEDKWFWITNRTTQGAAYADVVFNITDSTFGNNGTMALSIAYDRADPDLFLGSVTYNVNNIFFCGRLYPVTTWSPSYPYPAGHAGVFTVNVTGGSNRIEAVSGFDVVNIAAGASLSTDDFSGNKIVSISGELHAPSFSSGTEVHLLRGGTISGLVDLSADTNIATVEEGTLIDFDISGRHKTGASWDAQIKDLALFKNIPDFVLSVSVLQERGSYSLATGVSGFDKTITVRDAFSGNTLGTLSVGQNAEFLGQTYELSLSGGFLWLSVRRESKDVPASVDGLTVRSGQSFAVSTSQTATGTTVSRGGEFQVSSGGTAENTMVDFGGSMTVFGNGTASGIEVGSLGQLDVFSGGTATEILENGGFVSVSYGANVTFVPNVISGMRLSRGSATVHSGTTATDIALTYGGIVHVCSGAIADGMSVNDGGGMIVSRGGTATNATVNIGGRLNLYSSSTATNATVNSGGSLIVWSSGVADGTTVNSGGVVEVLNNGSANNATVQSGGLLRVTGGGAAVNIAAASGALLDLSVTSNSYIQGTSNGSAFEIRDAAVSGFTLNDFSLGIYSGVTAEATVVNSGGVLNISHGGTAEGVTVNSLGQLDVSGGTATGIVENGGYVKTSEDAAVSFTSHSFSGLMLSGWSATVHSGTTAYGTRIGEGGCLEIYDGGIVYDTLVGAVGQLKVLDGGTADAVEVKSGGSLYLDNGGKLAGRMKINSGAIVSASSGAIIDFDLTRISAGEATLVNGLSLIRGTPIYTLTVDGTQEAGNYKLADGASGFNRKLSVVNSTGELLGRLSVGETIRVDGVGYMLNLTDSLLSVTVKGPPPPPEDPAGTAEGVSWKANGADGYVVEYSTDDFKHTVSVSTTGTGVDTPELPAGTYRWRVQADGGEWAVGTAIVSENDPSVPKAVRSNGDGSDDLFFATPDGTWSGTCYALHVGSVNDWTGTNELVSANGKGRIQNLFFGSSDPNVLCLTDGGNGDAIFVDDVYTELPEEIEENTARLYKIREIRAGAGDDIVDMTSQQFEYTGDGLTIRGGDGSDTIWANKGGNTLFGDAGDDRIVGASGNDLIAGGIGNDSMHGGGGKDVFTFCDNWGCDTVRQLADGTVTLWFASGSMENWNAETLTYTDGENSVAVTGVAAEQVTLKFGDDGSDRYAALASDGAFAGFSSRRVFEESGAGILAAL